jgi:hypothetical protein
MPTLAQYFAANQDNPGVILMLRNDAFYEIYGFDAERVFGVIADDGSLPTPSFNTLKDADLGSYSRTRLPYDSIEKYLALLLAKGIKSAILDDLPETALPAASITSPERAIEALNKIIECLYMDEDGKFDPDNEWEAGTVNQVAVALEGAAPGISARPTFLTLESSKDHRPLLQRCAEFIIGFEDDENQEDPEEVNQLIRDLDSVLGSLPHIHFETNDIEPDDTDTGGNPCPDCGGLYCGQFCMNSEAVVN